MTAITYNPQSGICYKPGMHWRMHNMPHFYDYMPGRIERGFQPRVDISEDKDNYYFEFELPGIKKEDIQLKINDENILSVEGTKAYSGEVDKDKLTRNERRYGQFYRSFQLPDDIDSSKLNAKFDNGLLTLTIPKKEESKPSEINVEIN